MRVFLLLCAAVLAGLGAYVGYGLKNELAVESEIYALRIAEDRAGVKEALSVFPDHRFEQLVLGPGENDATREFRARVTEREVTQTAYGVIAKDCDPERVFSGCWRLTSLVIDGVSVEIPDPAPLPEPQPLPTPQAAPSAQADTVQPSSPVPVLQVVDSSEPDPLPTAEDTELLANLSNEPVQAEPVDPAVETGPRSLAPEVAVLPTPSRVAELTLAAAAADQAADPAAASTPDPAEDAVPAAETLSAAVPDQVAGPASHRVRLSLVNARETPSTRGAVQAQLSNGTGLELMESRRSWGRFRVLEGPYRDLEVWVAFSVLTQVQS